MQHINIKNWIIIVSSMNEEQVSHYYQIIQLLKPQDNNQIKTVKNLTFLV